MTNKADFPSDEAMEGAAWLLMCKVNAIKAVAAVEAGPLGAFHDGGEPVILFERHKMLKHVPETKGLSLPEAEVVLLRMSYKDALLSWPRYGGYGPTRVQHTKLAFAAKRNRTSALKACSWGLFQILGENHEQAGFPVLQRFVNAMYRSVDDHLRAFTMFVRHDRRLVDAIRAIGEANSDEELIAAARAFARPYNGPKYEEGKYHLKIAASFKALEVA